MGSGSVVTESGPGGHSNSSVETEPGRSGRDCFVLSDQPNICCL